MDVGLAQMFEARFGRPPALAARAPGRVNLIGEHTDYNGGLVLPFAIDRDTSVLASPRGDTRFRVFSRERDAEASFDAKAPRRRGDWLDYVQGVVVALTEGGGGGPGLDLLVASAVPPEAGLSSSAALGVAVATLLDEAWGVGLDARGRARAAHRGEATFVGVGCGIMDPFASALARRDAALRIDCRSLTVRPVALPRDRVRVLLADSGGRRELASAGYRERVEECAGALALAREAGLAPPDAETLRDVAPDALPALAGVLPERLLRRVRHVLTENARVDATCEALESGDLSAAGCALRQGMQSLREDYQVSTPELDALCALADARDDVFGSRLTGAGFGGHTLHLVGPGAEAEVAAALSAGFEARFGRRPAIHPVSASAGAERLAVP